MHKASLNGNNVRVRMQKDVKATCSYKNYTNLYSGKVFPEIGVCSVHRTIWSGGGGMEIGTFLDRLPINASNCVI